MYQLLVFTIISLWWTIFLKGCIGAWRTRGGHRRHLGILLASFFVALGNSCRRGLFIKVTWWITLVQFRLGLSIFLLEQRRGEVGKKSVEFLKIVMARSQINNTLGWVWRSGFPHCRRVFIIVVCNAHNVSLTSIKIISHKLNVRIPVVYTTFTLYGHLA